MGFDSRQYEWGDFSLNLGGRDLTGIRGVKYKEKIEREPLYAKGRNPHSIQSGNISYEGEITVLQSEMEALIKSGNGSLLNLKGLVGAFSYGDITDAASLTHDRMSGIYFTESGKELKQGDKNMEITIPFVATRLEHQV